MDNRKNGWISAGDSLIKWTLARASFEYGDVSGLNCFVWMIGLGDFLGPGTENAFSRVNTMGRFIEKHTRVAGTAA